MHCSGPNLFWHGCNEFHFQGPYRFQLIDYQFFSCGYLSTVPSTAVCDDITERCFWKETNKKTMSDARTDCQQNGGDLAIIETLELYTFVNANFEYIRAFQYIKYCYKINLLVEYTSLSYLYCVEQTRYSPSYRPGIIDIGSVEFSKKNFCLK